MRLRPRARQPPCIDQRKALPRHVGVQRMRKVLRALLHLTPAPLPVLLSQSHGIAFTSGRSEVGRVYVWQIG